MNVRKKSMLLLAALALGAAGTLAADAAPASHAGRWEGAITLPDGVLPIVVNLAAEAGKTPSGTIDIVAQGIRGLALAGVAIDGAGATFAIPGIPGDPTFRGKLSEDGQKLAGEFMQGGQSFPFELARKEGKAEDVGALYAPFEAAGVPGQGAAGLWRALLTAGPARMRLVLEVKKAADGTLSASMDSPDQAASNLPVDTIALDGKALRFEMPRMQVVFSGSLSEDGSTIAGQWSQAGHSLPLVWKRAGADAKR